MSAPSFRGLEWLTDGWVDGVSAGGWEAVLPYCVMPVVLVLLSAVTNR